MMLFVSRAMTIVEVFDVAETHNMYIRQRNHQKLEWSQFPQPFGYEKKDEYINHDQSRFGAAG